MTAPDARTTTTWARWPTASSTARAAPRSRPRSRSIPRSACGSRAIRAPERELRDAFDPWLGEALPPRLLDAAKPPASTERSRAAGRRSRSRRRCCVGLAVGWYARDAVLARDGTPTTFARQAAFTHVIHAADRGRPVEVWANEEASLVRWLTGAGRYPAHVPDLNPLGFQLVGGRLVAGNEKPTALVMYENAEKRAAHAAVARESTRLDRARPRSATRSRTASASSTGSRTMRPTRCPVRSTARSCSPSRASSTASSRAVPPAPPRRRPRRQRPKTLRLTSPVRVSPGYRQARSTRMRRMRDNARPSPPLPP